MSRRTIVGATRVPRDEDTSAAGTHWAPKDRSRTMPKRACRRQGGIDTHIKLAVTCEECLEVMERERQREGRL